MESGHFRSFREIAPRMVWYRLQLFSKVSKYFDKFMHRIVALSHSGSLIERLFIACRCAITPETKAKLVGKVVFCPFESYSREDIIAFQ
jgi:hypothetical protein